MHRGVEAGLRGLAEVACFERFDQRHRRPLHEQQRGRF